MLVSEDKTALAAGEDRTADSRARSAGLRTLQLEISGLHALADALVGELGASFDAAVAMIRRTKGRLIVSGIGKSGHIGRKIAATLASTGTPAYFVHATEASHGDLGMIKRIRRLPNGIYRITSDNPVVEAIEVADDEMHVVGRVVWVGRTM